MARQVRRQECASPLRELTPTLQKERAVTQLLQDLRARHNVQVYGWANELNLVLNVRGRGDKHLPELRRQSGCLMNESFFFLIGGLHRGVHRAIQ